MSIKKIIIACTGFADRWAKRSIYWSRKHFLANPGSRKRFKANLPVLSEVQRNILQSLQQKGIASISVDELFGNSAGDLKDSLLTSKEEFLSCDRMKEVFKERMSGERSRDGKSYRITRNLKDPILPVDDPILAFGLRSEILDIVNCYLQLFSRYVYADVWHTFKLSESASREASQNWHRDWEDEPLVKVLLFLSDIDETAGPFEYITQSRPGEKYSGLFPASNLLPGLHNYPDANLIERQVPCDDIVRGCGPTWTIVFCDTSGFHRGGFSTERSRTMGFFTYVSPASACPRFFRLPEHSDLLSLSDSKQSALS